MNLFKKIKPPKKARVGLYSIGLKTYWDQFEGLKDRIIEYSNFIKDKMSDWCEVYHYGLVDDEESGIKAGEWFNKMNVDLIFCHSATYATSSTVLPVHQRCKAPVILLNLQPTDQINYSKTSTGEWLAHCGACPVPEISNAFNRSGIDFYVVNGLLGLPYTPEISVTNESTVQMQEAKNAWKTIKEWIDAINVVVGIKNSRFGYLGEYYSGMLDMYSDFTMLQAQTGMHIEMLEMCDLNRYLNKVTDNDIEQKFNEINKMFVISGESQSDPIAKAPSKEQLLWSARVACAQEMMVREYGLDALSYYYHGSDGNDYEKLQSGFILGHSLLTAKGIPCAGEADIKTALAMKICDILGVGGSFCEIVVVDYKNKTILMGHDGPFHIAISNGKPLLRGMGLYHGKKGNGISVEAKVIKGDITTLGVTQTIDGKLKFIISEGESTDGEIMQIGNTQTPVKFPLHPDAYMDKWFKESPTHHFAMSVGKNATLIEKVGILMGINTVII